MVSANEIRAVVSRYLSQEDAEKFIHEFSALSHNIHKNGDAEAIKLANEIEMKMADVHSDRLSIGDFADFLRSIVNPFVMNVSVPVMVFASTCMPVNFPAAIEVASFQAWAGFFGTSIAEESGSGHRLVQGLR